MSLQRRGGGSCRRDEAFSLEKTRHGIRETFARTHMLPSAVTACVTTAAFVLAKQTQSMMGRVGGGVTRMMAGAFSPVRTHGAAATHIAVSLRAQWSSRLYARQLWR